MITIDPVISREFARFSSTLRKYVKIVEGDVGDLVRAEARLFGVALIKYTRPFGTTEKSEQVGKRAIARDIGRVYVSPGRLYAEIEKKSEAAANKMYALLSNGHIEDAKKLLASVGTRYKSVPVAAFDKGALHRKRRSNGKVRGSGSSQKLIVPNPKEVQNYVVLVQKRVGWAKSSWAADLHKLGGMRGVAPWVKKSRAKGAIQDKTRGSAPLKGVVFESHIKYMRYVLSTSNVRRILGIRERSMVRRLEHIAKKAAKKV